MNGRKTTMGVLAAAAMVLLGFPILADAQGLRGGAGGGGMHAGKFWKRPQVRRELKLTPDQVAKLEEIFLRNERALIDLRADAEKRQLELGQLLDDPAADERKLEIQVEKTEEARAKLAKARAMMMLEVRKVLTPEQREKLEQMRERAGDRLRERRGPGGPGGPDGPPPGEPPMDGPDDDPPPPPRR